MDDHNRKLITPMCGPKELPNSPANALRAAIRHGDEDVIIEALTVALESPVARRLLVDIMACAERKA